VLGGRGGDVLERRVLEVVERLQHRLALARAVGARTPGRRAVRGGLGRVRVDAARLQELGVVDDRLLDVVLHRRERVDVRERLALALPVREHRRPHLPRVVDVVGRHEPLQFRELPARPAARTGTTLGPPLDDAECTALATPDDVVHARTFALAST
jgi:hypothetical protein